MSARRNPGRRPRPPRPLGRGRGWIIAGLVVFVLADIVLVALALAAHRANGPLEHGPIPTFSSIPDAPAPTPTVTPSAPPSAAPTSAPAGQITPMPAPRFLLATSDTEAWRATSGSCTAASARLEHTTDAGGTWTEVSTDKSHIGQVLALGGNAARVWITGTSKAGGTAQCAPHFYASYTAGRFWSEYPAELPAVAYIDPGNGGLHLPSGSEKAPCDNPQHVVVKPSTAVLCPGMLFEQDAAGAWAKTAVPGAVAMTASDTGYTLAASGVDGCGGLAIESLATPLTENERPDQVGCAGGEAAEDVTLASADGTLWLWNGPVLSVSRDGGRHW